MVVVGITGNIATGKSTVMEMLAQRGALTIDADELVHQLLDADPAVRRQVVARFGPEVGTDRARLGAVVFHAPAAMRDLERILHPRVAKCVNELVARSDASVAVVEAIKLLESDLRPRCRSIWVTTCTQEQQIQRLMDGRKITRPDALARIQSQSSQAEKVAQADVVIDTSGSLEQTELQVEQAWRNIQKIEAMA